MTTSTSHQELILDQFTKQAVPFAEKPEHRDAEVMERLMRFADVKMNDVVLDVACGPGLMTCAVAEIAENVTGIDITPAMLEQARTLQVKKGLTNLTWERGDSTALPYADDSFSLVMTRYSFHHLLEPMRAWREMVRVCRPGGTVVVIDVALPREKAAAYDRFETLRDPSHTRTLTLDEFPEMARAAGLREIESYFYRLPMEMERQIEVSFPKEADRARLREMLRSDLGTDALGFEVERRGEEIWMSYPTLVVKGRK